MLRQELLVFFAKSHPEHFRYGDLKEAAGACGGRGELWGLNRFALPRGWHLATTGVEKPRRIDILGDGHVTGGASRMEFFLRKRLAIHGETHR